MCISRDKGGSATELSATDAWAKPLSEAAAR